MEGCPNRKPDRKTLLMIEECGMWKGSRERLIPKAFTIRGKGKVKAIWLKGTNWDCHVSEVHPLLHPLQVYGGHYLLISKSRHRLQFTLNFFFFLVSVTAPLLKSVLKVELALLDLLPS